MIRARLAEMRDLRLNSRRLSTLSGTTRMFGTVTQGRLLISIYRTLSRSMNEGKDE